MGSFHSKNALDTDTVAIQTFYVAIFEIWMFGENLSKMTSNVMTSVI